MTAEEVSQLPVLQFPGNICVVEDVSMLDKACGDLLSYPVIGFDTETRPSFKAGQINKVALLQLSTPDTCYLFRLCRMPLDRAILRILESKTTLKVGADVLNDLRGLQALRRFKPTGFVDLQDMAWEWGIAEKSVRKMSGIVLGQRVSKAQRLSNWEAGNLTPAQMQYAATDAWVCLHMHGKLNITEKKPLPQHKVEDKSEKKSAKVNKRRKNLKKSLMAKGVNIEPNISLNKIKSENATIETDTQKK